MGLGDYLSVLPQTHVMIKLGKRHCFHKRSIWLNKECRYFDNADANENFINVLCNKIFSSNDRECGKDTVTKMLTLSRCTTSDFTCQDGMCIPIGQ